MTAAEHLRLARRCYESQGRHAVTIPRATLAWLIDRAEHGRRIGSEAEPIAASPRGGRGRRRDTPLLPAVACVVLPGCAADADAILVAAAVLAPLWVLVVARRLRGRWAAEDAATRAATSRSFDDANRRLTASVEKFKASIERARGRA